MHTIAESNMLVRAHVELPASLKLGREEFREGWSFVRMANAERLRKKTRAHGWSLVKVADGLLGSGIGDTSQIAIASALKLALRNANEHCCAAEVEHIELTQYPWFFLARLRVYLYLIQQGAGLPVCDNAKSPSAIPRRRRPSTPALDLSFGGAMPELKQILILSKGSETRAR